MGEAERIGIEVKIKLERYRAYCIRKKRGVPEFRHKNDKEMLNYKAVEGDVVYSQFGIFTIHNVIEPK